MRDIEGESYVTFTNDKFTHLRITGPNDYPIVRRVFVIGESNTHKITQGHNVLYLIVLP